MHYNAMYNVTANIMFMFGVSDCCTFKHLCCIAAILDENACACDIGTPTPNVHVYIHVPVCIK